MISDNIIIFYWLIFIFTDVIRNINRSGDLKFSFLCEL